MVNPISLLILWRSFTIVIFTKFQFFGLLWTVWWLLPPRPTNYHGPILRPSGRWNFWTKIYLVELSIPAASRSVTGSPVDTNTTPTTPTPTMLCLPLCDPVYYIYCLYLIMLIKTIVQLAITIFSSIPIIGSRCCTMYCILHLVSFVNTLYLNRDRHRRRQSMIKV